MSRTSMRRGGSIGVRWLLLGVNGLVVLVPLLAVFGLKLYQNHLIARTETNLIGQAVLIGEAFRAIYANERGVGEQSLKRELVMPPGAGDDRFAPFDPTVDLSDGILPPLSGPTRKKEREKGALDRAGEDLEPLLARAQIFNLSSARVLDSKGCTVASSGEWANGCFDEYVEINEALAGRYGSVARHRQSDEPAPPFASISRRGDVRVFVAVPLFEDGEVFAVVWMSRTSMAPLKAAWLHRRPLTAAILLTIVVTVLVSLFLSRTITGPMRKITAAAHTVASGNSLPEAQGGFAPAEIRELEDALRKMAKQLSERARYVADYAANATHELKSPITAIRGAAELLLDEGEAMDEEQRKRFAANIQSDATRMERLVSRMLVLARIESETEVVGEVMVKSFLEQIAEGYGGRVVLEEDVHEGEIEINAEHLETAIRNLLDNAVRHGGDDPVQLGAAMASGRLRIRVEDRGNGIPVHSRARVFDRFFTTERDKGGTGLGLAIVRAVARSRGGEVSFETSKKGTVFTLVV